MRAIAVSGSLLALRTRPDANSIPSGKRIKLGPLRNIESE